MASHPLSDVDDKAQAVGALATMDGRFENPSLQAVSFGRPERQS